MRFRNLVGAWCAALTCLHPSGVFAQIAEVQQLKATFAALDPVAWTGRERLRESQTSKNGTVENSSIEGNSWIKVVRKDDKWAAFGKRSGESLLFGKKIDDSMFLEVVFNGRQSLQVNNGADDVRRRRYRDPTTIPAPDKPASLMLLGSIDTNPIFKGGCLASYAFAGKLVFGYVDYVRTLPDVLSEGERDPAKNIAGMPNCMAVTSKTPFGIYTAWLDSQHGYLPKRIEVLKQGTDKLSDGTQVNQCPPVKAGTIYPTGQLIEIRQVIDNITFTEFASVPAIKSFTDTKTSYYASDQQLIETSDFGVEEFHKPDAREISHSVRIPENSVVHVFQNPQIKYLWRNGEIVPDTTPAAIRTLERLSHTQSSTGGIQYGLIAMNVAVVLLLVFWIVRRRRAES